MYELCFPSSSPTSRFVFYLPFHSVNGFQRKCPSGLPTGITYSAFWGFFSVKGIFPVSQEFVERFLTQTPNCLMNPKDPQGMLKALQGSHGTQVSSLLCLRALFQLFLMYSGAQTARLTWPKWNHSILSTLPMEPQRQILLGKSWLWVYQAFWDHRHCRQSKYLCSHCNIGFVVFVIGIWSIALISQNSRQCSLNKNIANCSLW